MAVTVLVNEATAINVQDVYPHPLTGMTPTVLCRPAFARDYDSSCVGDAKRLPRGRMKLENNPEFWCSVHQAGEENVRLMEEAAAKDKVRRILLEQREAFPRGPAHACC
jgi:hypothetical protein